MAAIAAIARGVPLTAFTCVLASSEAGAGSAVDPVLARQAAIVLRALTHDRGLPARVGPEVVLAVVSPAASGGSDHEAQLVADAFRSLGDIKVRGLPFRVVRVTYANAEQLGAALEREGVDMLLVAGSIDPLLPGVLEVTRRRKLLSASIHERHTQRGVSLVVAAPDSKPAITVNLPASRLEGVAFSSDLLRLAVVVR